MSRIIRKIQLRSNDVNYICFKNNRALFRVGIVPFFSIAEHLFTFEHVIDAQYTKTSAGRILPQITVLETLIFFQEIFEKPMQTEEVAA